MKMGFCIASMFPCFFGTIALLFFGLGLRGIATKKPLPVSARWFFGWFVAVFTPFLLLPAAFHVPRVDRPLDMLAVLPWANLVMFLCVSVFMWFATRGYLLFGVANSSLRGALIASLEKLRLRYVETAGTVHFPSLGADLQIAMHPWVGAAQISVRQRQHRDLLKNIVRSINKEYQPTTLKMSAPSCAFYILLGLLMVVFAVMSYMAGILLAKIT
jgi:hypothetical protein